MIKFLTGATALFAASPALAHVSAAPIHTHGYETTAIGVGVIVLAALVWRFNKATQKAERA